MFDGVKITSWSTASNSVIQENTDGTIPRAWILLYGSEGGHIRNSEITHLGYETPTTGRGGLELHGSSHDLRSQIVIFITCGWHFILIMHIM